MKWNKVIKEWFWRADDVLTYRIKFDGELYQCTLTRQCASPPATENIGPAGSVEYAKLKCEIHYEKNYVPN